MATLSLSEIENLTLEYGGNWAVAHVHRLLKLIEHIGAGLNYDPQVMIWATYLHDWGALPGFSQSNCEHALRSKQVAEMEILPQTDLLVEVKAKILEAIELHDYRDLRPVLTVEALLLREADFLDFLGAVGIAREFAKGPKDLQTSYQQVLKRKEKLQDRFTLPRAKQIAGERLARMDEFFKALLEESFGIL